MAIKVGIVGAGHLGKIHLRCLQELGEPFEVVGIYDIDSRVSAAAAETYKQKAFDTLDDLIAVADVVAVITPTATHYDIAAAAIRAGRHVFVEKPVTQTLAEAQSLLQLAEEQKVVVQVGHVERFNPAMLAVKHLTLQPMFVEAHRLALFNPRGTDVPVVLDLMIHDIDIVLSLINSQVVNISANGVAVVSNTPDIANARVEFDNGCVANFTASRISLKQMRKVRLFQKDAYISLDFLKKESQILRMYDEANKPSNGQYMELDTPSGKRIITMDMPEVANGNAIKMEWQAFAESLQKGTTPPVSLQEGYRALSVAYAIMDKIEAQGRKQ